MEIADYIDRRRRAIPIAAPPASASPLPSPPSASTMATPSAAAAAAAARPPCRPTLPRDAPSARHAASPSPVAVAVAAGRQNTCTVLSIGPICSDDDHRPASICRPLGYLPRPRPVLRSRPYSPSRARALDAVLGYGTHRPRSARERHPVRFRVARPAPMTAWTVSAVDLTLSGASSPPLSPRLSLAPCCCRCRPRPRSSYRARDAGTQDRRRLPPASAPSPPAVGLAARSPLPRWPRVRRRRRRRHRPTMPTEGCPIEPLASADRPYTVGW